jgi:hypothetical protein
MEIETMSPKVLLVLIAGLVLGTTVAASAQTQTYPSDLVTPVVERGMPYHYWTDPYYGTPFENVAPYTAGRMPDPYAGTVYDGIAPY